MRDTGVACRCDLIFFTDGNICENFIFTTLSSLKKSKKNQSDKNLLFKVLGMVKTVLTALKDLSLVTHTKRKTMPYNKSWSQGVMLLFALKEQFMQNINFLFETCDTILTSCSLLYSASGVQLRFRLQSSTHLVEITPR